MWAAFGQYCVNTYPPFPETLPLRDYVRPPREHVMLSDCDYKVHPYLSLLHASSTTTHNFQPSKINSEGAMCFSFSEFQKAVPNVLPSHFPILLKLGGTTLMNF
jgi:hypothetical protein